MTKYFQQYQIHFKVGFWQVWHFILDPSRSNGWSRAYLTGHALYLE